jgi:transcriptional regulator with PAS, ATPase and Fis domain
VGATGIIGNSNAIQRINFLIEKAAKTKSTVLITGESGTGKTLIADKIHKSGQKSEKTPFVSVNCTAIPHQLFESELFGYVKGAFTGAEKSGKIGLFEMADGGTLFLDEIGELPQNMQVKLLQVLQSKSFYKVGATKPTKVDVRIIAATNKDLHSEIENRIFREDLYYRISAFPIHVAPLRERKADLYSLIDSISMKITESMEMTSRDISGEAMAMLLGYHWPGNVRELENVLELAYNLSESKMIEIEDIVLTTPITENAQVQSLKSKVEEAERDQITKILDETGYNIKKTIETLEISRSVFYEKAKKYEIGLKK